MDSQIKQSIEARKNAIEANCKLDAEGKKKVTELFGEIEKLGAKYKDVDEFEKEFTNNPLNQEYINLFSELATKFASAGTAVAKSVAKGGLSGVADRALEQVKQATLPTRAEINQKAYDAVRDVPVLGDLIDAGQKAGYAAHLGKLFKSKDAEEDEEEK